MTSPGRPKNPDPAPKAVSVRLPRAWGYSSRKKVYVIVSVGELPSESGGIGQYSYGVIVKMGDAVYNFQYCLSVAGVAYVPVDGGSGTGLVQTDNPDGRKGCFNFVDRRK